MQNLSTIARYLYGETASYPGNFCWDSVRSITLPVQSSPLKEYVNDVNRFLFSGGIEASVINLPETHYSHELIKNTFNENISHYCFSIWESLAIYGEMLAVIEFKNRGSYGINFYEKPEYLLSFKNGSINYVKIKSEITVDGKVYIFRQEINSFTYINYPLVLKEKENYYEWDKYAEYVNHNYGFTPVKLLLINPRLNSPRGRLEFNWASLNMAKSISAIEYGLDENIYFFGNTLIDSPDPRKTIADLNKKIQVLQKLPPDEGGGHDLLQPQSLTSEQLEYLKYKKESFKRTMGITNTQETQLNDASGVALRIMNDGLISKAQAKWQEIVENGFIPLLDKVLKIAQEDKIISLGKFTGSNISIRRKEPYFAETMQEKLQSLDVAERLIELGLDRSVALNMTFFSYLRREDIEKLLRKNLED